MVTVDDVLVDAFPAEMLQDLINAVDAVQDGLRDKNGTHVLVSVYDV